MSSTNNNPNDDDGKTKRFWAEVSRRMDCGNTCEYGSGSIGSRCDKCQEAEDAQDLCPECGQDWLPADDPACCECLKVEAVVSNKINNIK